MSKLVLKPEVFKEYLASGIIVKVGKKYFTKIGDEVEQLNVEKEEEVVQDLKPIDIE